MHTPPRQTFTGPTNLVVTYPAGYQTFDDYRAQLRRNLFQLKECGPTRFSTPEKHAALIARYEKDIEEADAAAGNSSAHHAPDFTPL